MTTCANLQRDSGNGLRNGGTSSSHSCANSSFGQSNFRTGVGPRPPGAPHLARRGGGHPKIPLGGGPQKSGSLCAFPEKKSSALGAKTTARGGGGSRSWTPPTHQKTSKSKLLVLENEWKGGGTRRHLFESVSKARKKQLWYTKECVFFDLSIYWKLLIKPQLIKMTKRKISIYTTLSNRTSVAREQWKQEEFGSGVLKLEVLWGMSDRVKEKRVSVLHFTAFEHQAFHIICHVHFQPNVLCLIFGPGMLGVTGMFKLGFSGKPGSTIYFDQNWGQSGFSWAWPNSGLTKGLSFSCI